VADRDADAALTPLPTGYRDLVDAFLAAVQTDERIRAAWLSGSLARGVADAGSDLDLIVTVRDDAFEGFAEAWREWLASWADAILARELPGIPGSFFASTRDGLRVDVVSESVSASRETPHRIRVRLLDRDGLAGDLPPADHDSRVPDVTKIADTIEEFLRQQVIFPAAVVARQDWLLGIVGVLNAHLLLYSLFTESNEPLPPMGVKQWSSRLTADQRQVLAGLPQPEATRESVVAAMQAVRHAFRTAGRARAEEAGASWPIEVDDAVTVYWQREELEWDYGS